MTDLYFYYHSDLDIEKNMVIEDINQYYDNIDAVYVAENFQYIKPALSLTIKIHHDEASKAAWRPLVGDVMRMIQDNKNYYFFITSANWLAKNTLQLSLALDTVNTFWSEIKNSFSAKTHTTRQHKNRIDSKGYRIFDKFGEGLTAAQYKKSDTKITATYEYKGGAHWYLVYKTANEYDPEMPQAIKCYAYPKNPIDCNRLVSSSEQSFDTNILFNTTVYLTEVTDRVLYTDTATGGRSSFGNGAWIRVKLNGNLVQLTSYKSDNTIKQDITLPSTATNFSLVCDKYYRLANNSAPNIDYIKQYGLYVFFPSGTHPRYIEPFESLNRADTKILRIIELAYAPFETAFLSDTNVPPGWIYNEDAGTYQLLKGSLEFNNLIKPVDLISYAFVATPGTKSPTDAHSELYESKLWTSAFYTYKFVYDSSSCQIKFENLNVSDHNYNININYKPSNQYNSYSGFYFDVGYNDELDFDRYLISQRDNEYPVETSEWINYLKYGRKAAEAQKTGTIASTVAGVIGSAATTVASGILIGTQVGSSGGAIGAAIGAGVGLVTGAISAAVAITNAENSFNAKEDQLRAQSANVSGTNDLDMFNWYADGKLRLITYEMSPQMKNTMYTLFRLGGYACDDYGVPQLNTRYWYNYIQCEPYFDHAVIYEDFIEDIISRFKQGITIYHNHNGEYDFEQQYENWEPHMINGN